MGSIVRFEAVIAADESIPDGYMKHYVAVPVEYATRVIATGVRRLRGSIGDSAFSRAVFVTDDGEVRLRFGTGWLKDAGLEVGELVAVEIDEGADPDAVDVPAELASLLEANPALEHLWEDLSPGRRRTLVYAVERAKREETRLRRAQAVVDDLENEFGLG